MKFTVKNVKTFDTDDGYAFSLTVYGDGKRLGVARNGGYGGPNEYEPSSLCKLLNEHAKTLPPITLFEKPMAHNDETFLENLIVESEFIKDYKASLRKFVLFTKNSKLGVFILKFDKNGKETMEAFIKRVEKSYMAKFDIKLIFNNMEFEAGLKEYKDAMDAEREHENAKKRALSGNNLGVTSPAMNF